MVSLFNYSSAQKVKIDTLKFYPPVENHITADSVFYFPVVKSGNHNIDSLINSDIVKRYTGEDLKSQGINSILKELVDGSLSIMTFNVSYNRNDLLSIQIISESCRANCNGRVDYFNYSIKTGKYLFIEDVLELNGELGFLISKESSRQFENHRNELKEIAELDSLEMESSEYSVLLGYYKECEESFHPGFLVLEDDYLRIAYDCDIHNRKNFSFELDLRYKYLDIQEYLKLPFGL